MRLSPPPRGSGGSPNSEGLFIEGGGGQLLQDISLPPTPLVHLIGTGTLGKGGVPIMRARETVGEKLAPFLFRPLAKGHDPGVRTRGTDPERKAALMAAYSLITKSA